MYKKTLFIIIALILVGSFFSAGSIRATTIGDNDPNAPLRILDVYVAPGGSAQVSLSAPRGTGFNSFKSFISECINTTAYSNIDGCYAWIGTGGASNSFVMAPGLDSKFFTADPNTLSPSRWGQSFTIRAASYTPEGTYTGRVYYNAGRWGPNGYVPNAATCCVLDSLEFTIVVQKVPEPTPISVVRSGLVWSTSANPEFVTGGVNQTINGPQTNGSWASIMAGLTPNTTYHVRAYALDNFGAYHYGNDVTFKTSGERILSIKTGTTTAPFSGDSRNQSITVPVTITATGFSNASEIIAEQSYGAPLTKFLTNVNYPTINTSSSIVNGATTLTINKSLTIVRNGENPTSDIIGDIRLTAFSTDGTATATPINVKVTIDGPILPPGDLQLLPRLQSMHVAERDLPKTVSFDVTASTTADCNSISYVNGYLPDTTSGWVTPMRGFGGNKCLTRFSIDLPANALSHLKQFNNSLTGVTAGTATINGTTTTGLAGFWVTVDPTSIVSPLTANLALSKSGAKVNEVITAGLTSAGGTGVKTYKINFGDGTGDKVGSSLSHAYAASGSYTVVGTVTDANGVTATDSKVININTVIVSGEGLSANLSVSPRTVDVGDSVNAVLSGSGGTGPYTTYKIDFGDGTISNTSSASNSYDAPGTYAVTGTVTDSASTTASKSVSVTVNYPRITAGIAITSPIPQSRIITPDKVIVSVSASGGRGAGTYRYSVDFGDGSSPMVYSNAGSGITNIQHTYAAISSVTNYQIQVTVTDVTGRAVSDSASVALTAYAPLVCTLNMNKSIGLPPFHPTFLVKTKGGTESKFEIRINADGSGTTDRTYVSNPATATTTLSNYVYLNSGSYSPIARVLDQDLIYNGFLMGTKNASTTCATSTTVLSGSGGETNPGL